MEEWPHLAAAADSALVVVAALAANAAGALPVAVITVKSMYRWRALSVHHRATRL
jgi:hypothetical protein